MKQYHSFIFESYTFDPVRGLIELRYSLDDEVTFKETLTLPPVAAVLENEEELDRALFALHLIGGISYYKTCCPRQIVIRSGDLSHDQAQFWNIVYENGLGEFFYKNNIDFRGLINFPFSDDRKIARLQPRDQKPATQKILVPIGGGKDSMVTIEHLRKAGYSLTLFRVGGHPFIDHLAQVADLPLLTVERQLSPVLFQLNAAGALNGHVPITTYLAFLSIVVAGTDGFDAVAFSNEASASEGNLNYLGKTINHQWSKSTEAETMIRNYLEKNISRQIGYFNPLRNYSELRIAETLTQYPQYLLSTTSCNTNWKILGERPADRWCRRCPKCAFVFALFAAYLPRTKLKEMFGEILYEDASLLPLYEELLGLKGSKPFECVGTAAETREAFRLAWARGDLNETIVMKEAVRVGMHTLARLPKKAV